MKWLESIVSTTLVVLTGCVLAVLVILFYMVATLFGKDLDPILFGSVLAFVGSCMGIGYKQFKAKRETAWAEDEDGIAYKPGTRVIREKSPNEKFSAGIKNPADFSDVEVVSSSSAKTTPSSAPVQRSEPEPEPIKIVEPEEAWEGDDS